MIGKLTMFKDLKTALEYIESKRTKRTFEQFQATIDKYGFNPHQKNIIHIAGTNGKGSTTNFIKSILVKHGYNVGTFTSPYMIVHNDRISINDQIISDQDLLRMINELETIIEHEKLSMFEIDVLIMLRYFDEQELDYRVIETGIGGLHDKTNIVDSICSVITNIGYDHQFMLGDSLEEIALHKAGIIKPERPCYTTVEKAEIINIFKHICRTKKSQLKLVKTLTDGKYPYTFRCLKQQFELSNCGSYQIKNAALAIAVCNDLIDLDKDLVQEALNDFHFPGRFERFGKIYLDGAHNIDGIKALVQTLEDRELKNVLIIFSALQDKDIDQMIKILKGYPLIQASFDDERLNITALNFKDVIRDNFDHYDNIVITGSLHFISVVRKYLLANRPN